MVLLDYFLKKKKTSATLAKERLQIILAHEHHSSSRPNFLGALQEDVLAVIAKYLPIDKAQVSIDLEQKKDADVLEVNITLPEKL
jgi:cell division topological specificity factor